MRSRQNCATVTNALRSGEAMSLLPKSSVIRLGLLAFFAAVVVAIVLVAWHG